MKPPIKVEVTTDNLHKCELRFSGSDEASSGGFAIVVPSSGNVYQGLHAVRGELEAFMNDLLRVNDVPFPPEPEPVASLADLEAEVAQLQGRKNERDEAKAAEERRIELEKLKADLEAEEIHAKVADAMTRVEPAPLSDEEVTPDAPKAE